MVLFDEEICIDCLICLDTCEKGLFGTGDGEKIEVIDNQKCVGWGDCITVCPTESLSLKRG